MHGTFLDYLYIFHRVQVNLHVGGGALLHVVKLRCALADTAVTAGTADVAPPYIYIYDVVIRCFKTS